VTAAGASEADERGAEVLTESAPANGENNGGRGPLLSLLNGIKVLEAFTISEPLLGVNEIARRVELHKSTVSRILATLEQAYLVERDTQTGRFRLGTGIIGLAGPLLAHLDVRRLAYPALSSLVELTGETAALAVWSGHESIVTEQIPSPRQVKHTTPLGARFAKTTSASVQVFLAEQDDAEVRRLLHEGLVSAGSKSWEELFERLRSVQESGYALNDGETDPEELSISAPVRDHRNSVVAAVLLSAPRSRMTPFRVQDGIRRVRETAEEVSARLGATS
jgi:DNA-binding IclR family transcriptional regulator